MAVWISAPLVSFIVPQENCYSTAQSELRRAKGEVQAIKTRKEEQRVEKTFKPQV